MFLKKPGDASLPSNQDTTTHRPLKILLTFCDSAGGGVDLDLCPLAGQEEGQNGQDGSVEDAQNGQDVSPADAAVSDVELISAVADALEVTNSIHILLLFCLSITQKS